MVNCSDLFVFLKKIDKSDLFIFFISIRHEKPTVYSIMLIDYSLIYYSLYKTR